MTENQPTKDLHPSKLNLAMFPANQDAGDLSKVVPVMAVALIEWSKQYGLDAWAGHTCFMYGKPYVTERGAIANAQKSKDYRGFATIPVPDSSFTKLGYPDALVMWLCSISRGGWPEVIAEYGVVTQTEINELKAKTQRNLLRDPRNQHLSPQELETLLNEKLSYLPLFRIPSTMARTRAIRRAHLVAFAINRQTEEDILSEPTISEEGDNEPRLF